MKLDKAHFRAHYAALSDDELAGIALTSQLTEVAQECLDAELARRGIADLSPFRRERDKTIEGLEAKRDVRVQVATRTAVWSRRVSYTISAWIFLYGAYLLVGRGSDEGFLFMLLGLFLLPVSWALIKINQLWQVHVLNRRWWPR